MTSELDPHAEVPRDLAEELLHDVFSTSGVASDERRTARLGHVASVLEAMETTSWSPDAYTTQSLYADIEAYVEDWPPLGRRALLARAARVLDLHLG